MIAVNAKALVVAHQGNTDKRCSNTSRHISKPNNLEEGEVTMTSRVPKNAGNDQPNDNAPLVLSVGRAAVQREGDRVLFISPEGDTPATEAERAAVRALSQPRTGTGSGVTVRIGFASKAVSMCRLVFLSLTIAGVASLLVDSLKPLQ